MEKKLKVLGMISGIGSMMIGAKRQGWDVVGNIEWRPYYHTGTFEYNFQGSFMIKRLEDLDDDQINKCRDLDLIIGHTECGGFSKLRVNKMKAIDAKEPGDIPEFVEALQILKPKFFAMDNLPKSLLVCDYKYYKEALPEYDIYFEWVNNYGYGNLQKNRNRLFVIGAKRELNFFFIPSEIKHEKTVEVEIEDLPKYEDISELNHIHWKDDDIMKGWGSHNFEETKDKDKVTLRDFKNIIKDYPSNKNFRYTNRFGESHLRPGYAKVSLDKYANVQSGGGGSAPDNYYRDDTLNPFTPRERARIQGCPDDFIFLPLNIFEKYMEVYKQIGKFMPVQFCTYLTGFIKDFLGNGIDGNDYTHERLIKPNEFIDENKVNYCIDYGYSNQENACKFCGSKTLCNKYQ